MMQDVALKCLVSSTEPVDSSFCHRSSRQVLGNIEAS
jgi:hypothetical protein